MKAGIPYISLLVFLFLGLSAQVSGQNSNKFELVKCARLETGLTYGGAVSLGKFNLHPGGNLQYSYCIKTGQRFGAGLGGGIQFFREQGFIPFYIDFVGFLNKNKNSPFFTGQAGYAFGWSKEFEDFQEVTFKPDLYLGAGVGVKFSLINSFSGYISLSYRHQMASVSYLTDIENKLTYKLNYSMFGLNIGIMLEQR